MSFKTYGQIKTKVELDLDLQDEDFIQADELLGYCNEAIKALEAIILDLCEDYFLDSESLSLVSGTSDYTLPTDMFADKIRKVVYANGNDVYEVKRMRYSKDFSNLAWDTQLGNQGQRYRYIVTNDSAAGRKIKFSPLPNVSGAFITMWYLRNAAQVTADADTVDIAEFYGYIEQFMKVRCYEKESNPKLTFAAQALEAERTLVVNTLSDRFPDDDTEIEQDLSHYDEHI